MSHPHFTGTPQNKPRRPRPTPQTERTKGINAVTNSYLTPAERRLNSARGLNAAQSKTTGRTNHYSTKSYFVKVGYSDISSEKVVSARLRPLLDFERPDAVPSRRPGTAKRGLGAAMTVGAGVIMHEVTKVNIAEAGLALAGLMALTASRQKDGHKQRLAQAQLIEDAVDTTLLVFTDSDTSFNVSADALAANVPFRHTGISLPEYHDLPAFVAMLKKGTPGMSIEKVSDKSTSLEQRTMDASGAQPQNGDSHAETASDLLPSDRLKGALNFGKFVGYILSNLPSDKPDEFIDTNYPLLRGLAQDSHLLVSTDKGAPASVLAVRPRIEASLLDTSFELYANFLSYHRAAIAPHYFEGFSRSTLPVGELQAMTRPLLDFTTPMSLSEVNQYATSAPGFNLATKIW